MTDSASLERDVRGLLGQQRFEEAEALLRPHLASGTPPLVLWQLLAQSIRPQGRIVETRTIQEMIVKAIPGDLTSRFNLAETLLLLGDFDRGWREYRWRYSMPHTSRIERKVQLARWDGQRIEGKTLLIHDEQGYGDTFQFIRMVPWAKARSGARVILEITPEALSIAQRMQGFDAIIERGTLPPAFDTHCEMMSLPMVMGLKHTDLPGPIPYLTADPARRARWEKRMRGLKRPLVALVWAGRPEHPNDANRSLSLSALAPIAVPGVTFVAIQKGPRAADANMPPLGMSLLSLSDEIRDFEDTTAILSVVDLLVSVDSSPVHLAGALGRPAWVLLPFVPDWRWQLERADTPWYPSMRLFRQKARNDWRDPLHQVSEALTAFREKKERRTD